MKSLYYIRLALFGKINNQKWIAPELSAAVLLLKV
jgi:hypothetical protein